MRKFRATFRPDYGKKYVFYGKAEDPQLREAELMTHGLHVKSSDPAGKRFLTDFNTSSSLT